MSAQADTTGHGPRVPGRGMDPRAVRSRAAALAAAQELLVEQGWAAVTHVTVAARSGVGRTTLYRHWPDAASLLYEAIAQRIASVRPAPTGVLRDDLIGQLDGLRELLHDDVAERGMRAVVERAGVDPAFSGLKEALYQAGSGGFRAIIGRAKEDGTLHPGLDVELAIDQLAGALIFRRLLADRAFGAEYVHAVADAFLAANAVPGAVSGNGNGNGNGSRNGAAPASAAGTGSAGG
ncbi:TetR/AcrR family transcriptional regulator C-terminal ligand-binding domain-containing protein [Streptomyces sp. NPDC058953]|uniref:TetR/AcrR family transcriptional regulator n=1 Tax=unclassified Streptomyces TaxID=2593676 RepID=UPI0036A1BD71